MKETMAAAGEAPMARMASGDVAAFEVPLRAYQGVAYRYSCRIFRDRHIAEDVSHET
jgi:DNA-directed RNA polymerase specialized sigma24 family protein